MSLACVLGASSYGKKVPLNTRITEWGSFTPTRCLGTENTAEGRADSGLPLRSTPGPLLNEGHERQNCLSYLIAFFTLAICIMDPCKLNAGSEGMPL